jgi:hypothetical protein
MGARMHGVRVTDEAFEELSTALGIGTGEPLPDDVVLERVEPTLDDPLADCWDEACQVWQELGGPMGNRCEVPEPQRCITCGDHLSPGTGVAVRLPSGLEGIRCERCVTALEAFKTRDPWHEADRHPFGFRCVDGTELYVYERPAGAAMWSLVPWVGRTQAEVLNPPPGDQAAVVFVYPGTAWDPPEQGHGLRAPCPSLESLPPELLERHGG